MMVQRRPVVPTRLHHLSRPLLFRAANFLDEADRVHALHHVGIPYRPPPPPPANGQPQGGQPAVTKQQKKQAEVQRRRQQRIQKKMAGQQQQQKQKQRRKEAVEAGMPSEEGLAQSGMSMGVDTTGIAAAIVEANAREMTDMVAKTFHLEGGSGDDGGDESEGDGDGDGDNDNENMEDIAADDDIGVDEAGKEEKKKESGDEEQESPKEKEKEEEGVSEEDAAAAKALVAAAREAVNQTEEGGADANAKSDDKSDDNANDQKKGANDNDLATKVPTKPALLRAPPDPDTLLSRLNTRRLYQRAKHYRSHPEKYAANNMVAVPTNKTVEQIADDEWDYLLEWQRWRNRAVILRYKKERKGEDIDEAELQRLISLIDKPRLPTKYELLMFSPCPKAVTVLASYPRSGNSLCRALFERSALRVTGSDMRGGLIEHDLVGEAAVSAQRVQYVKTHYPERRGAPQFRARRVVLLVRNPFDAIQSYWNLMVTNTHTNTAEFSDEQKELAKKHFADVARKEIQVWKDFHEFWLSKDIDLLLVRYEDLIRHTSECVRRIMAFTLEVKNMATFFGPRVDRVIKEEELEKLGSYKPRSGGIGKSLKNYPPELMQEMTSGLPDILGRMGYDENFLVPDKELWDKTPPLDGYACQWDGTKPAEGEEESTIVINGGPLVRTPELDTNWREVKKSLGLLKDVKCDCARCRAGR